MNCPPSFDAINAALDLRAKEGGIVVLRYDELRALVRVLLDLVEIDEAWYKATCADVAQGIATGIFPSAKEHFIRYGYFEGRLPHGVEVDEAWYYEACPDVAAAFEAGGPSAKEHYLEHGYREGRSPVRPASAAMSAAGLQEETP